MKITSTIVCIVLSICLGQAKLAYVDASAPSGGDGTSWANAWTNLPSISGVGAGDTVYVSGGAPSKVYNMGDWTPPSGNASAQFTLAIGQDQGHDGIAIFRNNAGSSNWLNFTNWVTINGRLGNANHFRVEGFALLSYMDKDTKPEGATGIKILGITTDFGAIRMYDSRKIEIGWIVFEPFKRQGGPGWIIGIGRGDGTGWGNNSVHDCTFNLFYLHGVDSHGDNGDDGIQNVGAIDIYNNRFVSKLTTGFAGANHQDAIQSDGWYIRIFNNYFENIANYSIFGEFWGPGTVGNWAIFNNVFNYADPVLRAQPSQAIAFDIRGGDVNYVGFQVFNNTFLGANQALSWTAQKSGGGVAIDNTSHMQNNLTMAGSGGLNMHVTGANQCVMGNNAQGVPANYFVNPGMGGDYHLTSSATGAIDKGANLGNIVAGGLAAKDKDGSERGETWDVGAFEFGGTPQPTPVPTPTPNPTPTPTPTPSPFQLGTRIVLIVGTNVRTSPGIADNLIGENPAGTLGTLVEGPASGTGAYAWWRVDYDNGFDGWSGENNFAVSDVIQPTPTPTPIPIPTPTPTPQPTPMPPEDLQIKDIRGLQEILDRMQQEINEKASISHTHLIPAQRTSSNLEN